MNLSMDEVSLVTIRKSPLYYNNYGFFCKYIFLDNKLSIFLFGYVLAIVYISFVMPSKNTFLDNLFFREKKLFSGADEHGEKVTVIIYFKDRNGWRKAAIKLRLLMKCFKKGS